MDSPSETLISNLENHSETVWIKGGILYVGKTGFIFDSEDSARLLPPEVYNWNAKPRETCLREVLGFARLAQLELLVLLGDKCEVEDMPVTDLGVIMLFGKHKLYPKDWWLV